MSELEAWDSFYVIIGSAAGALIGLQFVVVTLVAERPALRATEAGAAFATPTIVHFSAVLLVSALICIPWHGITPLAALWAVVGLGGLAYELAVARTVLVNQSEGPFVDGCEPVRLMSMIVLSRSLTFCVHLAQ